MDYFDTVLKVNKIVHQVFDCYFPSLFLESKVLFFFRMLETVDGCVRIDGDDKAWCFRVGT